MLPILFPFFLLVACKSPDVDAGTVKDIVEAVPPIVTEVVKALTPTPTFGFLPPIKDYFVFASSSNCESTFEKASDIDPLQSIVCRDNDITVRYDQWIVKATMDEFHANVLTASEEVTRKTTWNDSGNPDDPLGNFYEFKDREGNANIIWTVTTSALNHLSGWAVKTDGDQDALYDWWAETGSDHN